MNPPDISAETPLVSVVVVNFNCKQWLDQFFPSLRAQTIFDRVEVILVDNSSKDGSAETCERIMADWSNGVFVRTGGNYGFGGGSNRGAKVARGEYLLFLNPDVRLEKNCLEELAVQAARNRVEVACPLVLDYDTDAVQTCGASGFDLFGNPIPATLNETSDRRFSIGTFFFVRREAFEKLGGFDEEFFLYGEEMDLSWRAWLAGNSVALIRTARIHHQAASAGARRVENRTTHSKRFYSNRNQLLTILKNARGLLLLLGLSQALLMTVEAVTGAVLARQFYFLHAALFRPAAECWRLRRHIGEQRAKNRIIRRRGDLWMLRHFFRFGFGRRNDVVRLLKFGVKIDAARSVAR